MRLGFYSARLHIAGGGEKYFLTMVDEAAKRAQDTVILMSPTQPQPRDWERLGISLSPDSVVWRPTRDGMLIRGTRGLDLFVCMRWIPPLSHAARSVTVVQFPPRNLFAKQRSRSFRGSARALRNGFARSVVSGYDLVVCYSDFGYRYTADYFGRPDAVVIYPPVDPGTATGLKDPIILGVARFFHGKRQDALIDAFHRLRASLPADSPWELHLAGGTGDDPTSHRYMGQLGQLASGAPITFHPNASLTDLRRLYQRASIFWHATGLGSEDIPIQQEHFGITTVEAMNHGCVPVVIALGGQPEIVSDHVNGVLWRSPDELVARTLELIRSPARRRELGRAAAAGDTRFTVDLFRQRVREVILP